MKATDMTNLYVGRNKNENFNVLICAQDREEATDVAREYGSDAGLEGSWEIAEFDDPATDFDCDTVLTYSDSL